MPKNGFRSITVSETIYNRFNHAYAASKESLAARGVRSLSGYISYMLEDRMREDEATATSAPKMRKISVEGDRVILHDTMANRVAEVAVRDGTLFCHLCEKKDCIHVGFALSLPEVYAVLDGKGANGPD